MGDYTDIAVPGTPTTTTPTPTKKKNKKNLYAWQQQLAVFLKIDQVWSMYAPYPRKEDGFFLLSGQFEDGKQLDLWNGDYFFEYGTGTTGSVGDGSRTTDLEYHRN